MNKLFLVASLALLSSGAMAQTGVASGTPYGSGQDSIQCRRNLSLFSSFAKTGQYQDAYEPWKEAYTNCPGSSKNIYIYGTKILNWRYEQEKDANKRKAILNEILSLFDNRIKYFGDDDRFGVDAITAAKISEYLRLAGEAADYKQIFDWAKVGVDSYKEATNAQLLYYYSFASRILASKDKSLTEDYINNYQRAAEYLDKQIEVAGSDSTLIKKIEAFKTPMDSEFAQSGLAGCDELKNVYTSEKIDAHKTDKNYLKQTCILFQMAGCDAPVYFLASRHLFELEPSADAAMGLAGEAIENKNFSVAKEYLTKAADLATDSKTRAKVYGVMAQLAMNQHSYGEARTYAGKTLAENPKNGAAQIIMAQILASSASSLFSDPIKQRCVLYLVISKLRQAAASDPSVSGRANQLIGTYSRSLPSATDIFMHPDLGKGKTFAVPGWGSVTLP